MAIVMLVAVVCVIAFVRLCAADSVSPVVNGVRLPVVCLVWLPFVLTLV